jgi:hypothetical protein
MFDSLEREIETAEGGRPSATQRVLRFVSITVASAVVLGGLYLAIVALE